MKLKLILGFVILVIIAGFVRVWAHLGIEGEMRINSYEYIAGCWQGDVRLCDYDPFGDPAIKSFIITNFGECVSAGNSILESYPRQCRTKDGRNFIEDIGNELEKTDLIRVSNPRPNQSITSPLVISGEARGTWFFEANLPLTLLDQDGNTITRHYAMATDEWMTEDFVPFEGTLEFETPNGVVSGTLIIYKDNPSDMRELDDQVEIPVIFASYEDLPELVPFDPSDRNEISPPKLINNGCRTTGCSGQICSDKEVASTCEWWAGYGCYQKYGQCERQGDGKCGWTDTPELHQCIDSNGAEFEDFPEQDE